MPFSSGFSLRSSRILARRGEVIDEGQGVEMERLHKIFEPFFQVEDSLNQGLFGEGP